MIVATSGPGTPRRAAGDPSMLPLIARRRERDRRRCGAYHRRIMTITTPTTSMTRRTEIWLLFDVYRRRNPWQRMKHLRSSFNAQVSRASQGQLWGQVGLLLLDFHSEVRFPLPPPTSLEIRQGLCIPACLTLTCRPRSRTETSRRPRDLRSELSVLLCNPLEFAPLLERLSRLIWSTARAAAKPARAVALRPMA